MNKTAQKGNALFYVLLGVVLFAALSFIITRQTGNDGLTAQLADDKADIIASQMINHATSVKFTIEQMLANGSTIDQIDFVRPDEAGYDTPPHQHKVFHPSGGGVNGMVLKTEYLHATSSASRGWNFMKGRNIEWTPTTQTDLLYTFLDLAEPICKAINKKIKGDETMPALAVDNFNHLFSFGNPDTDFDIVDCPSCEGLNHYCVRNPGMTTFGFYNVVAAR